MVSSSRLQFEEVGDWSVIKHEILKRYLTEYEKIFKSPKQSSLSTAYIDAFAGSGQSLSRSNGSVLDGSPLVALDYHFDDYHFIELNPDKAGYLKSCLPEKRNICVYVGDCNEILLSRVFPQVKWADYRRGVCFLDPYGLSLDWKVIETAGRLGTIDMILNFPVMDMNRNVFWHKPEGVDPHDIERMNSFWGNESWRQVVYKEDLTFFGPEEQKAPNFEIALAFQERLKDVAKFKEVPRPCPMRNSRMGVIYYLFFASQRKNAHKIMDHIFKRFGTPRPSHE